MFGVSCLAHLVGEEETAFVTAISHILFTLPLGVTDRPHSVIGTLPRSSCSKLTMSLVNVSLKF